MGVVLNYGEFESCSDFHHRLYVAHWLPKQASARVSFHNVKPYGSTVLLPNHSGAAGSFPGTGACPS
jgi:hypothetical protein